MKIALCLYGKVGNRKKYCLAEPTMELAQLGFNHYKKNLLDCNNVDVFYHCWNPEFKDELNKLYNPKGYAFQKQFNFGKNLSIRQFAIKSSWFSRKKSIAIMDMYQKKHNMQYDAVILCRFDAALMKKIVIQKEISDLSKFYFNGPYPIHDHKNLKKTCRIYCCEENSDSFEIGDLFYLSNPKNMKIFSTTYDFINDYGLTSNHIISRKHMQKTGLWNKKGVFLSMNCYNYNSWNSIEDGDITLVRWVYDVGADKNENT